MVARADVIVWGVSIDGIETRWKSRGKLGEVLTANYLMAAAQ